MSQSGAVSINAQAGSVGFSSYLSSPQSSVTGDSTLYTVIFNTVAYQVGGSNLNTSTGVFTAPTSGLYSFTTTISTSSMDAATNTGLSLIIVTTTRSYRPCLENPQAVLYGGPAQFLDFTGSCIAFMNAGDTAYIQLGVFGNPTKNVTVESVYSSFSGCRVA